MSLQPCQRRPRTLFQKVGTLASNDATESRGLEIVLAAVFIADPVIAMRSRTISKSVLHQAVRETQVSSDVHILRSLLCVSRGALQLALGLKRPDNPSLYPFFTVPSLVAERS